MKHYIRGDRNNNIIARDITNVAIRYNANLRLAIKALFFRTVSWRAARLDTGDMVAGFSVNYS